MSLTREPREYIWALPIIGGILTLISFFTPAHYVSEFGIDAYYWMWGIYHLSFSGYGSETIFMVSEDPSQYTIPIFFSGLVPAILIFISSLMLIISANSVRTGKRDIKNVENGWIGMGFMLILASIIYIISIDITWMNLAKYTYEQEVGPIPPNFPEFWDNFDPGFAIIAPFIGAGLSILGSIASKTIKPREVPFYTRPKQGGIITKTPIGQISHKINFCPECGHQLLYDGSRFCSYCGNELKF
ncbi:MAG: zinc-ribbon domain-containing protein [Candidatus Hermodarchaeota archaeon]